VEEKEFTDTVSVIVKIPGKSLRSLERICSPLNLPEEIQNALREGAIGVSQVLNTTVTPAALLSPRRIPDGVRDRRRGYTRVFWMSVLRYLVSSCKALLRPASLGDVRLRNSSSWVWICWCRFIDHAIPNAFKIGNCFTAQA